MSLAFLTKPIGGSKKGADPAEPKSPKQGRTAAPGPVRGGATNVGVGGSPRVDLMPPEIRVKRSQLRTRRSLRLVLVAVFIIVVVACGATWVSGAAVQATLSSAQAQHQLLLVQQQKYAEVTGVKSSIALVQAAQRVGDSSEIDWQSYLNKLQATLPAGVALATVRIDSATPLKGYTPSTVPLQGDRIATLAFSATSASLPSIPQWLDGLATLPGFADATPGAVSLDAGVYTATVTMHINTDAFANRFAPAAPATAAPAATGGN